jgi:protein-disulfide isomerase
MKTRLVISSLLLCASLGCQPEAEMPNLDTQAESQAQAGAEEGCGCKGEPQNAAAAPNVDDPNKRWPVTVGDSPSKGPVDAPVTLVVFSDFECPYCAKLVPTLHEIAEAYPKEVRIVFKNMPLPMHPRAALAAEAALAAAAQDRFWEFHDALFAEQNALERPSLIERADNLDLNLRVFERALDDGGTKAAVDEDRALAEELGVRGTPTTFINGKRVAGARPASFYRSMIDEELGRQ